MKILTQIDKLLAYDKRVCRTYVELKISRRNVYNEKNYYTHDVDSNSCWCFCTYSAGIS